MFLLDSSAILEIINDTAKAKEIIPKLKGELFTTPSLFMKSSWGENKKNLFY